MILMFAEQKNERYKEAASLLLNYLENLVVDKEKVTFIYKYKGIVFAELALISAKFQRYDEAETYITDACQYALRFDAKPNYLPQDIKLLKDEDVPALLLDGLGETAILAIENFVFNNEEPSVALDFVKKRFEDLKYEGING